MGGTSAEHDVSVNSGLNVLDALSTAGYRASPVYLRRDGVWRFDHRPAAPSLERAPGDRGASMSSEPESPVATPAAGVLETLRDRAYDVVFIALHGPGGEDGEIQGLLTHAGLPFTGSGILASALAMDKVRAKRLLASEGIPVAAEYVVDRSAGRGSGRAAIERVGLPCVVKPVAGGSSFGTQVVRSDELIEPAIAAALEHDRRALVERYVEGRELTCGVLGGGCEPAEALPLTEIRPIGEEFFDFRAKYTAAACDEITPAQIDAGVAREIRDLARRAHDALGCEGVSRGDFILGGDGPVMLEVNTIPGFTRTSLLPQGAAAAGIDFEALVDRLVASALCRAAGDPTPVVR